jgi:PAS domain S-box-containing protein
VGDGGDQNPDEELRQANEQLVLAAIREQELGERARQQAAQLSALIEQLQAGVVLVDGEGRLRVLNHAARTLFGSSAVVGQSIDDLGIAFETIRGSPLSPAESPLRRMTSGESFAGNEVVVVCRDGQRRRVIVGASAVRDQMGHIASAVAILHDVTDLRALEKMREEYIAFISHDLRSPLTSVMFFSSLLERLLGEQGLETEADNAKRIRQNAEQMRGLIQDLMDSTRIEGGQRSMRKSPTDIGALVRRVCDSASGNAKSRIHIDADGVLPVIDADGPQIERAITNLITNALKYSTPDSAIGVRCAHVDGAIVVSVTDRGPGIAKDAAAHVFDKYFRAGRRDPGEGIGLGLYITRLIAEAHGGTVSVQSEVGKGSTFQLILPVGD